MLVPLYGFLQGDTIGLLVLAHDDDTMEVVARKLATAAAVRIRPSTGRLVVEVRGAAQAESQTVAGAGLKALDRIDVRPHP